MFFNINTERARERDGDQCGIGRVRIVELQIEWILRRKDKGFAARMPAKLDRFRRELEITRKDPAQAAMPYYVSPLMRLNLDAIGALTFRWTEECRQRFMFGRRRIQ